MLPLALVLFGVIGWCCDFLPLDLVGSIDDIPDVFFPGGLSLSSSVGLGCGAGGVAGHWTSDTSLV